MRQELGEREKNNKDKEICIFQFEWKMATGLGAVPASTALLTAAMWICLVVETIQKKDQLHVAMELSSFAAFLAPTWPKKKLN